MTESEDTTAPSGDVGPEARRPSRSDVIGTAILGAVGVAAVVMGLQYGFTQPNGQVGPGFLPVLTGGFIALAAVLELVRMYVAPTSSVEGGFMEAIERVEQEALTALSSHQGGAQGDDAEVEDIFGRTHAQRGTAVIRIFAVMLGAILLTPVLGLLISLALMTFVILKVVERKGWVVSILVSLVALAVFHLIFAQGLNVPLPTGMLDLI